MKQIFYTFLIALVLVGCKNSEESKETSDNEIAVEDFSKLPMIKGEFIHTGEAAVLKGANFIYAVQLDSMADVLAAQVAPVKKEEFDMVPVVVQGIVGPNPKLAAGEKVWEEIIAIKNIVSVSAVPAQADVKIEDKN